MSFLASLMNPFLTLSSPFLILIPANPNSLNPFGSMSASPSRSGIVEYAMLIDVRDDIDGMLRKNVRGEG